MKSASQHTYEEPILASLKEALSAGLSPRLTVISESMSPLLTKGDIAVVTPWDPSKGQVGDIIVFENDCELTTHRVIICRGHTVLTRGDNAVKADPVLEGDHILGSVKEIHKSSQMIDLETNAWKWTNYLAGKLSYLQYHSRNQITQNAERLFPEGSHRVLKRVFRVGSVPFQAARWLLMQGMMTLNRVFL
jgi:signal peptidase I